MGILVKMCATCGHYHGRVTNRCLEPRCGCPTGDQARARLANVEAVVAPWPPGIRKGDIYRAIGGV